MKLNTKLVIIFITIMILPIALAVVVYWAMGLGLLWNVRKASTDGEAKFSFSDPSSAYNKAIDEYYDLIVRSVEEDAQEIESLEHLCMLDENLQEVSAYLVVRKGDAFYYISEQMEEEPVLSHLPIEEWKANNAGYDYYFNEYERLVKQINFTFSDGSEGHVFIITRINMMISDTLIASMFVMIIIVLVVVSILLTWWLRKGIFKQLNEMKETIDHIEEERQETQSMNRELISNITHDLKTPITSIKGYVEGIMDGVADSPEKMERYIRTIYTKTTDMDRMINELTMYSKIETKSIPYQFTHILVREYFNDCAEEVSFDVEAKGISFDYECAVSEKCTICADAEQMKRVIDNIISNSIKYAEQENPHIRLKVYQKEKMVYIELEDNGKGIPKAELEKVFERFYRTDASRNSSKGGSGIGLSIAKRIVEDHGGKIYATGDTGVGVCIHIELQRYISEEELAEEAKGLHKIETIIKTTAKGMETRIPVLKKNAEKRNEAEKEVDDKEKASTDKEGLFKWLNKGGKKDE